MTATTGEIPLLNGKATVYPGLLLSKDVVISKRATAGCKTIVDGEQHLVDVTPTSARNEAPPTLR